MAFKDILVTLTSYPDPTPVSAVEDAITVAAALGAHITALSCEVHVEVPGHFISGSAFGLPGVIAGEAARSRKHAQDLLAAFDAAAASAGVSRGSMGPTCAVAPWPAWRWPLEPMSRCSVPRGARSAMCQGCYGKCSN